MEHSNISPNNPIWDIAQTGLYDDRSVCCWDTVDDVSPDIGLLMLLFSHYHQCIIIASSLITVSHKSLILSLPFRHPNNAKTHLSHLGKCVIIIMQLMHPTGHLSCKNAEPDNDKHCAKKPVTTMLTYPWKCTVLHCNHLGNTWKPLVLMT